MSACDAVMVAGLCLTALSRGAGALWGHGPGTQGCKIAFKTVLVDHGGSRWLATKPYSEKSLPVKTCLIFINNPKLTTEN